MSTVVVLDACVLFPMPLCDTLFRIAETGLYRPQFSQEILDETTRNLVKKNRITQEKAARYQNCIKEAFPDAIIEGYEKLVPLMTNDIKDRHVLAAAVKAKADVIVTFNLKDFPLNSVEPFDIKVKHPDDFLLDILSKYGLEALTEILQQQAAALKKPPMSFRELLQRLSRQTPDFYRAIFYFVYSDYLANIAKEAISLLGQQATDGFKTYCGNKYILKQKFHNLVIEHKIRGEILKIKNRNQEVTANFTIEDLEIFENFKQELDRHIKELKPNASY